MIAAGQRLPVIAQQLVAARASLDSLLLRLVEIELKDCLPSPAAGRPDPTADRLALVVLALGFAILLTV